MEINDRNDAENFSSYDEILDFEIGFEEAFCSADHVHHGDEPYYRSIDEY